MVSVMSQPVSLNAGPSAPVLHTQQPQDLNDAIDSFTQRIKNEGVASVRLHCTVPTWSPASGIHLDLHDLQDLRSRMLSVIHDLVNSLRSEGVMTSYSLVPSNSSHCLVCALSPLESNEAKDSVINALQSAGPSKRKSVVVADTGRYPSLIIS